MVSGCAQNKKSRAIFAVAVAVGLTSTKSGSTLELLPRVAPQIRTPLETQILIKQLWYAVTWMARNVTESLTGICP